MLKTLLKLGTTVLLGSTVLMSAAVSQAAELPQTKVNVVGTWANLSVYKEREQPFWTKTIPTRSGGAITADIKGFNEMGLKGAEVFRLMRTGVIDFGSTILGYVAGDDPENEAVDLAGFSADIETARNVVQAYKPVLSDLYEKKYGIKMLAIFPIHAQVMYCKTPITSLTDLKGKKVRTFSKSLSEFVSAVGGTGVNIAFSEVVPALQKGVADCAITGAYSGNLAKWHEVTTHLYALPVGWGMIMHGVNLKTWNGLSENVQSFLTSEIATWENEVWNAADAETQTGIACNTGGACTNGNAANIKLVPVSTADRAKLREIMETVIVPKWANRCGAECVGKWNNTIGKVVGITAKVN